MPEHVRSDNGAEMTARRVKSWLASVGTKPLFIEPGSPWENGHCESFNGKQRDECLNGEVFYSLKEAQVVIEQWRKFYDTLRPHSALISASGAGQLDRSSMTPTLRTSPFACPTLPQTQAKGAAAANRSSSDIPLSNWFKTPGW